MKSIHLLNGIWFLLLRALPGHASPSSAHTGCADQLKCFSLPMSLDQSPGIFFSWNPYHSFFFPLGSSSYYQVLQLQSSKFCQQMNTFFFFLDRLEQGVTNWENKNLHCLKINFSEIQPSVGVSCKMLPYIVKFINI